MVLLDGLQRRVRATKEEVDKAVTGDSSAAELSAEELDSDKSSNEQGESENESGSDHEDDDQSSQASSAISEPEPLTNISFGALASAQALLCLKRKHSSPSLPNKNNKFQNDAFAEAEERRAGKSDHRLLHRTSKHAPMEFSSKKAVSRKRSVVPIPTIAHRDPRFEPLTGPLDIEKIKKNYSFLNDYRALEVTVLKANFRNTKDPVIKEAAKKQLLSMESKEKARLMNEAQQDIVRDHRKSEKEAVKAGKKPFYLKQGEQKRLALVKKFETLGEKEVEKVIERRRKKKAGKERKAMPFERRGGEGLV